MTDQTCQDCGEVTIACDDRRWNNNQDTIYCRECVHQPVFDARSEVQRLREELRLAEETLEDEKKIASDKAKEVALPVGAYRPITFSAQCDD